MPFGPATSAITQAFLGKRGRSGVTSGTPQKTPSHTVSFGPAQTTPTGVPVTSVGPSTITPFPPSAQPTQAEGSSSSNFPGFNPFARPVLARWAASQLGGPAGARARAAAAGVAGLSVDDTSRAPRRSDRDVASDGDASGDDSEPDSAETVGSVESEKYDALVASVGAIAESLGAIARVVLVAFPDAARIAAASAQAEAAQQAAPLGSASSATPIPQSASQVPPPASLPSSSPMDI